MWRNLPHPKYGYWGGAPNTCSDHDKDGDIDECPLPIDWADTAFRQHDLDLMQADDYSGWRKFKKKYAADKKLGRALWKGKYKDLYFHKKKPKGFFKNITDRLYIPFSRIIFFRF